MYQCKYCGCSIGRTVEGELICASCWAKNQMADCEIERDQEMLDYLKSEAQGNDPGCTGGQKICWWQSCSACRFHRGVPVVERVTDPSDPCGKRYNPDVPDCELPL